MSINTRSSAVDDARQLLLACLTGRTKIDTSIRSLMLALILTLITTTFSIMGTISPAYATDPNLPSTDAPAADLAKLYDAANAADIAYQTAKARVAKADA